MNYIFLQTKAQSVGNAMTEAVNVLNTLQGEPPAQDELAEKKAAIRNSFVFNFDSADDIVGREARLELLHYPSDYDRTYLPKIEAVEPQAVATVAKDRWQPSNFVVVVVGNESAYSNLEQVLSNNPGPFKGFEVHKLRFDGALVQ
jgi:predicted Zn-dependent peptidase